ncbi:MAG TPA: hypothetical protein DD618_00990 [Acholeplasmatales bacterium]|nr:hypothetical protein [Acholeplasmatales bacterium]
MAKIGIKIMKMTSQKLGKEVSELKMVTIAMMSVSGIERMAAIKAMTEPFLIQSFWLMFSDILFSLPIPL